jgi:hypothetical protein
LKRLVVKAPPSGQASPIQYRIQSYRDETMRHLTKLVVVYLTLFIILAFILTEGCLGKGSELNGKNRTEKTDKVNNNSLPNLYNGVQAKIIMTERIGNNLSSSTGRLKTKEVNLSGSGTGNTSITGNYHLEALDVGLKVPAYELPLQKGGISNYGSFSSKIHLSDSALRMLENNGFAVIENPYSPREEDITSMYSTLKDKDIPIFITTDSLLHLYHIQFDETLRQIEEKEFYDTLWKTDLALLNASIEKYSSTSGEEQEAAKRNAAYFSVALSLLQPKPVQIQAAEDTNEGVEEVDVYEDMNEKSLFPANSETQYHFEIPEFVKNDVEAELSLIEAHQGFGLSPIFKISGRLFPVFTSRSLYSFRKTEKLFQGVYVARQNEHAYERWTDQIRRPCKRCPHSDYPGRFNCFRTPEKA